MEQINIKGYEKVCPICKKVFTNTNEKQLEWNYKIHYESCKGKDHNKVIRRSKTNATNN